MMIFLNLMKYSVLVFLSLDFSQITVSQPASVTIISNETQEKPFVYVTTEQQSIPEEIQPN